jgi:hypothetical protein
MAYRDYKPCDLCKNKTFYDADLYNFEQYPQTGLYNLGAWKVLCLNCSKNYVIQIVEKDPAAYMTKDGYVYGQHETRPVDADIPLQKPVAMMFTSPSLLYPEFTTTCGSAVMNHPNWTPLYDHPNSELTDEEIWRLWQQHLNDDIPVFARSILKKAREK